MRRFLLVFVLLCGPVARAEAVTLSDLIDLSKQGLSDELLIALVEADKSVFHLNAADVRLLKHQGLSDRLLIHLLKTPSLRQEIQPVLVAADARPAPAVQPAPERIIVIERVETVPVPVYVPVITPSRRHDRDDDRDHDGQAGDGERRRHRPEPVYWGYGGKLRPDAWTPQGHREQGKGQRDGKGKGDR